MTAELLRIVAEVIIIGLRRVAYFASTFEAVLWNISSTVFGELHHYNNGSTEHYHYEEPYDSAFVYFVFMKPFDRKSVRFCQPLH